MEIALTILVCLLVPLLAQFIICRRTKNTFIRSAVLLIPAAEIIYGVVLRGNGTGYMSGFGDLSFFIMEALSLISLAGYGLGCLLWYITNRIKKKKQLK